MAVGRGVLISGRTSTSGTTTYTLTGDTSLGFRTLAKAVANGDVSDGDTVYYVVVDNTSKGDSTDTLDFERGSGVVGSSGTTITRSDANVTQSSNSGNRVSWPSGGSRTVYIALDPEAFAILAAANTFSAAQTFSAGLAVTGGSLTVDVAGETGEITAGSNRTTGAVGTVKMMGHNANGSDTPYGSVSSLVFDPSAGSEDGQIRFNVMSGGVLTERLRLDHVGNLSQAGGALYALQGVLSAPSGTKMVFKQATPPTGWTKDTTDNDAALRVVSGTPGASAGTRGLSSATVGSHALLISQIPSHSHTVFHGTAALSSSTADVVTGRVLGTTGPDDQSTSAAGSSGSHDHALALKYVDVIVATKT